MTGPTHQPDEDGPPATPASPGDDPVPAGPGWPEPPPTAPPGARPPAHPAPPGAGGVERTVTPIPPDHAVVPTRAARLWVTLGFGTLFLLAVLIFIIQNGSSAKVHFVTLQGSLPLGIALLLAAVGGALVAVLLGAVRITQLRRVASRHRRRPG